MKSKRSIGPKRQSVRLAVAAAVGVGGLLVHAQRISAANSWTWNQTISGNWSTATWNPAGPPTSSTTTALTFGGTTAYTATNDIAGTFTLNSLSIGDTALATIAGNAITFGGTAPSIVDSANGGVTISNSTITFGTGSTVNNNSNGTLSIGSATSTVAFGSGTTTFTNGVNGGGNTGTLALVDGSTFSGSGTVNLYNYSSGGFTIGDMAPVSGTLNIAAGTVTAANTGGDLFGNSLVLNVSAGATFDFNSNGETMGGISGAGNILLTGGAGVDAVLAGNRTFSGVLSLTGALTQDAVGTLTLSGANSYSGTTAIKSGGTIIAGAANALSPNSVISITGGAGTLGLGGFSQTIAGLNGGAAIDAINIASGTTLTINSAANQVYQGGFTGSGNLTFGGTATQTVVGNSNYTGSTTVSSGILRINATNFGSSGVSIAAGATFDALFAGNVTFASPVSGSGTFTVEGLGTVTLSTANASASLAGLSVLSGGVTLDDTTNNGGQLGPGTATALTIGSATLSLNGNASAVSSQTFAGTTLTGGANISVTAGNNHNATINLGAITRNFGSALNINLTNSGTGNAGVITTTTNNATNIIGDYATLTSASGGGWAVYNSGASITALAAGSYTNDLWSNNTTHTTVTTNSTVTNNATTYDLRFNASGANTVTLAGTDTLAGGGILVTNAVGAHTSTITGGTALAVPANVDLIINQFNSGGQLTIASAITNTAGTAVAGDQATWGAGSGSETLTLTTGTTSGLVPGMTVTATTGMPAADNVRIISIDSPTTMTIAYKTAPTAETATALTFTPNTNVVITGPGTTQLSSASNTFAGLVSVDQGTLVVGATTTLNAVSGGSSLYLNGGAVNFTATFSPGTGVEPWIFGPAGGTLNVNSGITVTRTGNGLYGSGPMYKTGTGTLAIGSNASGFTGPIVINGGTILETSSQIGSAQGMTVNSGGQFQVNDNGTATFGFATNSTFTLNGNGPNFGSSANPGAFAETVQSPGPGPITTISNQVYLAGDSRVGDYSATYSSVLYYGATIFSNKVSGPGALIKDGPGTLTLSNPFNAYGTSTSLNGTVISNGTLALGVSNAIPTSQTLQFGESASGSSSSNNNSGTLDLVGFNQTLSGLVTQGTGTGQQIVNSGAGASTLTVNYSGGSPDSFTGQIGGGTTAAPANANIKLVKSGSGTLTLPTAGTYSGTTAVQAGGLVVNGNSAASAGYTISDGAALTVINNTATTPLSMGTLKLGTSGTTNLTLSLNAGSTPTSGVISVTTSNGLTLNGTIGMTVSSAGALSIGQFPLITYVGSLQGSGFSAFSPTLTLPFRIVGNLVNDTSNHSIDLNVTSFDFLKWNGNVAGQNWNTTDANWVLNSNGNAATYTENVAMNMVDTVQFDDSASNFTVNIPSTVNPVAVTVNNSINNYTFQGAGGIGGSTGLIKNGTATLIVTNSNNYTGGTTINFGTVQLGNGGTTGSFTGTITGTGTLALYRTDNASFSNTINGSVNITAMPGAGALTLSGGITYAASGNTAITNNSSNTLTLSGPQIYSAGSTTTFTGSGAINLSGLQTFNSSGGGLTYSGSGGMTLGSGTGALNYAAGTKITNNGSTALVINGSQTFAAGTTTTFTGGDITAATAQTFGNNSSVVYTGTGTLTLGTTTGTGIAFGASTAVNITNGVNGGGNTGTVTLNDGGTYSGTATTIHLANYSSGNLNFGNMGSVTGTLNINAGYVRFLGDTTGNLFGDSITLNVASGATFDFNANPEAMGTISGSGIIQGANVTVDTTGNHIWAGNFAGIGAFGESSGVNYTFTGTNTGTGLITVPAATSFAVGNGTNGSIVANISNAGTVTFNTSSNNTYPGVISGAGAVNVTGTGTTFFSGTSINTGTTTVSNGTLQVLANATARPYILNNGAGMIFTNDSISTTFAMSTFSAGAAAGASSLTFQFNGGLPILSQSLVNVTTSNGLTLTGNITVNVTGTTAFTYGDYPLIKYAGSIGGDGFSALTLNTAGLPFRTAGTLYNDTSNNSIDIQLSADGIKWNGTVTDGGGHTNWNTVDANWTLNSTGLPTTYVENGVGMTDTAVFDDSVGSGSTIVTIPGTVSPNGVTVNNNSFNYTFQGAGQISGSTGLTKTGSGTLAINNSNNYTGVTTFAGGTVIVSTLANSNQPSPIGAATSASSNILFNGGTLQYNGSTTSIDRGFSIGVNGGTLTVNNPASTLTISGNITGGATTPTPSAFTFSGPGNVTLTGGNTEIGTININGGTLSIAGQANLGSTTAGALTVNITNNATLAITGGSYSTASLVQVFNFTGSGGTVTIPASQSATKIGDNFTGSGTMTIAGGGTMNIESSGGGSFFGNVNVGNGSLGVANNGAVCFTSERLTNASNYIVNDGSSLYLLDTTSFTTAAPFHTGTSGGYSLTLAGDGSTTLPSYANNTSVFTGSGAFLHTLDEAGSSVAGINIPITINPGGVDGGARFTETAGTHGTRTAGDTVTDVFQQAISGSGNLIKDGEGTMILAVNNFYGAGAGETIIADGTIEISTNNALPEGTTLVLGDANDPNGLHNSGMFDVDGNYQIVAGLVVGTGSSNQVVNSGATAGTLEVKYNGGTPQTFSGSLGGTGGNNLLNIATTGTGNIILTGTNTYIGTTSISNGTVTLGNTAALGTSGGAITVNANGTLDLNGLTMAVSKSLVLNSGLLVNNNTGATATAGFSSISLTSDSMIGGNGNLAVNVPITGSASLTKIGTGTTTLAGNNSYTNSTFVSGGTLILAGTNAFSSATINSGTLQVGNGGTTGAIVAGSVFNNGTLAFNRSDSVTFGGSISGSGLVAQNGNGNLTLSGQIQGNTSVTQNGTGVLALTGNNSYDGLTTVNAGSVTVAGGSSLSGGVTVNGGGTFAITNPTFTQTVGLGALTFGTGTTTLDLGVGTSWNTSTPLITSSALSTGGATTINLSSAASLAAGTYELIGYGAGNSIGGNRYAGFTLNASALGATTMATLSNDAVNGFIDVTISGGSLIWTGSVGGSNNGNWDTANQNWNLTGNPHAYADGDAVVFDDTAVGTTSVTLSSAVSPASVTFRNSSTGLTYTISGTGKITGPAGVTLTGNGTVILATDNDYTGGTIIENGTLQLGNGGAAGSVQSDIANNGALVYNQSGNATAVYNISGSGSVTQAGANTLTVTGSWTHTGGTTINSGAALQIGAGGTAGSVGGAILDNGALVFNRSDSTNSSNNISGNGSVAQIGGNTLTVLGNWTQTGGTTINSSSTIQIGSGGTSGSISGGDILVNGNLIFDRSDTVVESNNITGTGTVTISNGTLQIGNGTSGSLAANVVNNANLVFNIPSTVNLAGTISGTGALTLQGGGTYTLNNSNSYTGVTTVGTATVNVAALGNAGANSAIGAAAADSGNIILAGGTLNYTGVTASTNRGFTIGSGTSTLNIATAGVTFGVSGVVTGAGTLNVNGSGTLSLIGPNTITGTININSGATLAVQAFSSLNSTDNSTPTVNFNGGTIQIGGAYATGSGDQPWVINAGGATINNLYGSISAPFGGAQTVAGKTGNSISGSGQLTYMSTNGSGVFNIGSNSSSFSGQTTVVSGILRFTSNQFSNAGSVTVDSGASYMLYDTNSGPFNLNQGSGASLILNGNGVTLGGGIGVTGSVGNNGGGAFLHVPDPGEGLSPTYAFNSPIVLATTSRVTDINASTARGYAGAGTTTDMFTQQISGSGQLIKDGDGTLIISNNSLATPNNYAGTIVSDGILKISNGGATPAAIATGGTNILPLTAPLQLGEASLANSGTVDLFGNSQAVSSLTIAGTGTANQVINSSNTTAASLAVNPSGPDTFAGQIGGGTTATPANANISLTVGGTGPLTLTQANTYSGGTILNSGALLAMNGATGSATGAGSVTVNGGRLGGTGTVAGAVTVATGGTISPGATANLSNPTGADLGTLTTGAQTWNGGGTYLFKTTQSLGSGVGTVTDTASAVTGQDFLLVNGTLDVESTSAVGNQFILNFVHPVGTPVSSGVFIIANFNSLVVDTNPIAGPAGTNLTSDFTVEDNGVVQSIATVSVVDDSNLTSYDIQVNVPEPGSLSLLGVASFGLLRRRRNFPRPE